MERIACCTNSYSTIQPLDICWRIAIRLVAIAKDTGLPACGAIDPRDVRMEVHEYWPSDLLRLFAQAGIPRRLPPAPSRHCAHNANSTAQGPKIVSPLRGVDYLQDGAAAPEIPLKAVLAGEVRGAYWFVDGALLGATKRGEPAHLAHQIRAGH